MQRNIDNDLMKAKREYDAASEKLIGEITKAFNRKNAALQTAFDGVLGLAPEVKATREAVKASKRVKREELNEGAVIEFAGKDGKSKGEFVSKFAGGAKKILPMLDKLATDGKLEVEKRSIGKGPKPTFYAKK